MTSISGPGGGAAVLQMLLLRQSLDNQRTVAANVVAALDGADAAVPQVESSGVDLML